LKKGFFGEKDMQVSIEITRKYILAALRNWVKRLFGAQDSSEYLVVIISLLQKGEVFCTILK